MEPRNLMGAVLVFGMVSCCCLSTAHAQLQLPYFHDDFEDGSVTDGSPVSWSPSPPFDSGADEVIDGSYVLTPSNEGSPAPQLPNWNEIHSVVEDLEFEEVSMRTQLRGLRNAAYYVGLVARSTEYSHLTATIGPQGEISIGAVELDTGRFDVWTYSSRFQPSLQDINMRLDILTDQAMLWAWAEGDEPTEHPQVIAYLPDYIEEIGAIGIAMGENKVGTIRTPIAYRFFEAAPIFLDIPGDFNHNNELDVNDIDLLTAATLSDPDPAFDLNDDGRVDFDDREVWINELKNTWIGDANLNGEFNSSDLVQVFVRGKYETGEDAGWAEGDWNGDAVFDSSDMVTAFADGGYERGARADASAVPEPTSVLLLVMGLAGLAIFRRRLGS